MRFMPITTNSPEAVEQALQRMMAEDSYLFDYLSRVLGAGGWDIGRLSTPLNTIARYQANGSLSYLIVSVNPHNIEVEAKAVKRINGDPMPVYKSMRTCGDLSSAQEHIETERMRLEVLVREEHESITKQAKVQVV